MTQPNYIQTIRSLVGHNPVILNFAGCCVLNDEGEVLLQKRGGEEQWGFPGGALELGESFREAAVREVYEETGVAVEIKELIGVYSKFMAEYPNGDKAQAILTVFLARPIGGSMQVDGEETLDVKYFPLGETPVLFNDQHNRILSDLRLGLRNQID